MHNVAVGADWWAVGLPNDNYTVKQICCLHSHSCGTQAPQVPVWSLCVIDRNADETTSSAYVNLGERNRFHWKDTNAHSRATSLAAGFHIDPITHRRQTAPSLL